MLTQPDYETTVTKIGWFGCNDRNNMLSWFSTKGKGDFFQQIIGIFEYQYRKKKKNRIMTLTSHSSQKLTQNAFADPNIKSKPVKLLRENVGESIFDLGEQWCVG